MEFRPWLQLFNKVLCKKFKIIKLADKIRKLIGYFESQADYLAALNNVPVFEEREYPWIRNVTFAKKKTVREMGTASGEKLVNIKEDKEKSNNKKSKGTTKKGNNRQRSSRQQEGNSNLLAENLLGMLVTFLGSNNNYNSRYRRR